MNKSRITLIVGLALAVLVALVIFGRGGETSMILTESDTSSVGSPADSAASTNTVTTVTGFSFTLPEGWVVDSQTNTSIGQFTILTGPANTQKIRIECPPVGKGYEEYTPVSASNRLFTSEEKTYAISYTEHRSTEYPSHLLLIASLYPAPAVDTLKEHPSDEPVCIVVAPANDSDGPQVITAVKAIADSWR